MPNLKKWKNLQQEVEKCDACALNGKRVLGSGSKNAKIMIVGEAPGATEIKEGKPFVGKSGKILRKKLNHLELDDDVYITNCALCRPKNNRDPKPVELQMCKKFLLRQIKLINPKLVISLGAVAFKNLTGRNEGITKNSGRLIQTNNFDLIPIIHPASLLYSNDNEELWDHSWRKVENYILNKHVTIKSNDPKFVHLHSHSEHSVRDAYGKIPDIVEHLDDLGFKAGALTDHGTGSGLYEFYKECKSRGIKPILGCEVYVALDHRNYNRKEKRHMVLLAKNIDGYYNLLQLITLSHRDGFYYKPRIDFDLLSKYSDGLICLTGCYNTVLKLGSDLAEAKGIDDIYIHNINRLISIFGDDVYIELMPHRDSRQIQLNKELITIAKKMNLKTVLTNDCHYIESGDVEAHRVMTKMENREYTIEGLYIRTWNEMVRSLKHQNLDVSPEELLNNIDEVNGKIQEYEIPKGNAITPIPQIPDGSDAEEHFKKITSQGLEKILKSVPLLSERLEQVYRDRFAYECKVIMENNFVDYFLIVYEYLEWCQENNIKYQCRGSVGGSLVAYSMGITNIDPIKNDLLFERFISPNRSDLPDIDVDVEDERREEVIDHLRDEYGAMCVAHMQVLVKMTGKLCFKEIARYLGMDFGLANDLVDNIQKSSKGDERAHKTVVDSWPESNFDEIRNEYPEIPILADKLEGEIKTKGTHAAGVFVAPEPLFNYFPLECGSNKASVDDRKDDINIRIKDLVTAYGPKQGEELGLLKLDILASNMLTILSEAEKMCDNPPDWDEIAYNDKETFENFNEGRTLGVHQFGGSSITDLTKQIKVNSFNDLCVINALHRPGPLESGVTEEYIERKHEGKRVVKIHKQYDKICRETYGLIVYQEQVFNVLRHIGNMGWDEVNKVRKLVSRSKGQEIINKHRQSFVLGAQNNDLSEKTAHKIFDNIVKYGRYGFNKSHSALYSSLSFKSMYLKVHHTKEYMASLLCYKNTNSLYPYIVDAEDRGIAVELPDINKSKFVYTVDPDSNCIVAGLCDIDGIGLKTAEDIIENQPYKDMRDFLIKVKISLPIVENLIKSGAFDDIYGFDKRKALIESIPKLFSGIRNRANDYDENQQSIGDYNDLDDAFNKKIEQYDNSWSKFESYTKQLSAIEHLSPNIVIDVQFLTSLPSKILNNLSAITTVRKKQPKKTKVLGWHIINKKLKSNVRFCTIVDELGNGIEYVDFNHTAELDALAFFTPIVATLKQGKRGYVLDSFEPVLSISG